MLDLSPLTQDEIEFCLRFGPRQQVIAHVELISLNREGCFLRSKTVNSIYYYRCSRKLGHPGPHVAMPLHSHNRGPVLLIWESDKIYFKNESC